jgi:menaquinone-dependent protoporphyrinogen oxidase
MSRILVLYSSNEGQAKKIAGRVADTLTQRGHAVSLEADTPAAFARIPGHDAVVIGAAIRYGHHARGLEQRVKGALPAIEARPNAFFSVSLSAGGPGAKPANVAGYLRDWDERTGWHARRVAAFAGALPYSKYNPFLRLLMRLILKAAGGDTDSSRDYEYTDWQAVERFALEFSGEVDRGSHPTRTGEVQ